MAEVIRPLDGPLAEVRGLRPEATTYEGPAERLQDVWVAVRASLRTVLEQVTIADIVSGTLPRRCSQADHRPGRLDLALSRLGPESRGRDPAPSRPARCGAPDPRSGTGIGRRLRPDCRRPTRPPAWPETDRIILAIVCLAQFMVVLDISIVNVALPSIQQDLGFSAANLQWVVTAYSLTFGGLLLLGGRLADLFGRRRIFLIGLVLFTGASLLGGFAGNQATLIAARALQGVGAAVLSPATLTILTVTFTEQRARAKALGVWSAVAAGGGAAGALFGGFLTQYLSWRWILFVNVPIGVVLFVFARRVPGRVAGRGTQATPRCGRLGHRDRRTHDAGVHHRPHRPGGLDVDARRSSPAPSPSSCWPSSCSSRPRWPTSPLVPLRLFRSRAVTGANLVMFCFGASMFAMWFFLSLYLQQVLGYDPVITGLTFLPQTAAIAVGATIAGRLAPRLGPRNVLMAGALCTRRRPLLAVVHPGRGQLLDRGVRRRDHGHVRHGPGLHPHRPVRHRRGGSPGGRPGLGTGQLQPADRGLPGPGRPVDGGRHPDRLAAGRSGGHRGGGEDRHDRRLLAGLPRSPRGWPWSADCWPSSSRPTWRGPR